MKKSNPSDSGIAPKSAPQPVPNRNESKSGSNPAKPPDWATLTTMPDIELVELARATVKRESAVTAAATAFAANLHLDAKVCAALKRLYTARIASHEIPGDTKFTDFYEQNAGGKAPGRVLALSNVWNSLVEVEPQRLTEAKYDGMPVDALERAAAVITAARKKSPDKWAEDPHVRQTCEILNTPPPDGCSKALKKVRDEQTAKPEPAETAKSEPVKGTIPGEFGKATVTFLVREAARKGFLGDLIRDLGAELASVTGTDPELCAVADAFQLAATLLNANAGVGAAYSRRKAANSAKPKTTAEPTNVTPTGKEVAATAATA